MVNCIQSQCLLSQPHSPSWTSGSKCKNNKCSCFKAEQLCSDVCQCVACENRPAASPDNTSVLDDTTEDEEDDESEEEVGETDSSDDEIY